MHPYPGSHPHVYGVLPSPSHICSQQWCVVQELSLFGADSWHRCCASSTPQPVGWQGQPPQVGPGHMFTHFGAHSHFSCKICEFSYRQIMYCTFDYNIKVNALLDTDKFQLWLVQFHTAGILKKKLKMIQYNWKYIYSLYSCQKHRLVLLRISKLDSYVKVKKKTSGS